MLGIIGGSGFARYSGLQSPRQQEITTPYGVPSAPLIIGKLRGREVAFLARHGNPHVIAPHKINYRANIWAMREQGVTSIIAIATVGGIGPQCTTGTLAMPDQIIDYTWGREASFFDGVAGPLKHIDFTRPYCEKTRTRLAAAAQRAGVPLTPTGTYAATQGPRLETAAEIDRLARDGVDLVGMTGMPEAALARELDLGYATLAVIVNDAAGRGASAGQIDLAKAEILMQQMMNNVQLILEEVAGDGD